MNLSGLLSKYYSISIIGMCKNAGKTTVLNKLVEEFSARGLTLGLTSVGRDGESTDVVTITPKPEIFAPKGTLVATAKRLLNFGTTTNEILAATGINTPLGEVIVFRALSRGFIQIAGPSITGQLKEISELFKKHGADKMLIDGAVSRRSLSSAAVSEATVLSTGASLSPDLDEVAAATAFAVKTLTLPICQTVFPEPSKKYIMLVNGEFVHTDNELVEISAGKKADAVYFSGGLTDAALKPLIAKNTDLEGTEFAAFDGSRIFLREKVYNQLIAKGARLTVKNDVNLTAVTVNPVSAYGYAFDAEELKNAVQKQIDIPVYDVKRDL